MSGARFADGDQAVHGLNQNFYFHGITACGWRVEWQIHRSSLEPRGRRFGFCTDDPVDCMTCLVNAARER